MVKKTLLSLAIAASTAGLTACNISSTNGSNAVDTDPIDAGQPGQIPATVSPLFNPARGQLPLATDFLFGFPKNTDGTTKFPEDADGTLYHAGAYEYSRDGETRELIAPGAEDYNPVLNALNEMDGVSINAEIDIPVNGNVDISTVLPGQNLILVPLNYDDPITGDLIEGEAPFKAEFSDFTVSVVEYAVAEGEASKFALRVNLTKPLASKTRYLVIVANNGENSIKDLAGNNMVMPAHYKQLASDDDLLNPALAPARDLVQSWSTNAQGYLAFKQQDPTGLVMAYTLTTGGGIEVLSAMAAPGNANPALQQNPAFRAIVAASFAANPGNPAAGAEAAAVALAGVGVPAESIPAVIGLAVSLETPGPRTVNLPAVAGSGGLAIGTFNPALTAAAKVLTGTIDLPYYLKAPMGAYTGENPLDGYLCTPTGPEDADCIAKKTSAGNTIVSQWTADDTLATDLQNPALTPPSTNVTRLFPFAMRNGMRKAPVMIVKPNAAASAFGHSAGYPVIIYQSGIFGDRTDALAVANQMANAGFVTVSMDFPLHGVMPTDLAGATGETPMQALLLMAQDINFLALTPEQQVAAITGATVSERHFGLTKSATGFTPTAVSATDADLNASGSLFFNLVHLQTARDNLRQPVMDLLNLNASLATIDLDNDPATTDIDVSQVHFTGHSLGGIVGTTFVATNNLNGLKVIGSGADGAIYLNPNGNAALPLITEAVFGMAGSAIPRLLEASASFGPAIKGPITTPKKDGGFGLIENEESYNQLFYVFQGSLDSADPASFAPTVSQIPGAVSKYMIIESVGDLVVPNSATSPLAGTDPLAALLATSQIDGETADFASGKYFVKFNDKDSSHGSLATPGKDGIELDAFTEITKLTVKLFMGADPEVEDSTVVSPVASAAE